MMISYKWLQTYFVKKLPTPANIAEALTFHAFEIESLEKKMGDTVIDVKILPNRAHDCLSHDGVAGEVAAILGIPQKKQSIIKFPRASKTVPHISVSVKEKKLCPRYMAIVLDGVKVGPSPKWLREKLEVLGQRSVNNIVDATNYIMFMTGQPLHAFDHAKLTGGIIVRNATDGEQMTTLDKKDVVLNSEHLVIADNAGVLGIAGIKGGLRAEVDHSTKTIVLESANFDASNVRMSAMRLGIKTDASKRFESGLTSHLAGEAMKKVVALIVGIAGGTKVQVGTPIDIFPQKPTVREVKISLTEINRILGTALTDAQVRAVWRKLGFTTTTKKSGITITYEITPPAKRLDIVIKEDLAEEIGRMVGYDALIPIMPTEEVVAPAASEHWVASDIVREVMLGSGYSEVYTYAFNNKGEIEVANPIASDKRYLRNNLSSGLKNALVENLKYENEVRIFELGHIFGKDNGVIKEEHSFAGIFGFPRRKESQMKDDFYAMKGVLCAVFEALGISNVDFREIGGELVASIYAKNILIGTMTINGFEINFGKMVELRGRQPHYVMPSRFPSIIRDISLFIPKNVNAGIIADIINAHAGVLLRSLTLFDVFEQPERKSLGFRMVLQSNERTLSDEEANDVYNKVVVALQGIDIKWEVRA